MVYDQPYAYETNATCGTVCICPGCNNSNIYIPSRQAALDILDLEASMSRWEAIEESRRLTVADPPEAIVRSAHPPKPDLSHQMRCAVRCGRGDRLARTGE